MSPFEHICSSIDQFISDIAAGAAALALLEQLPGAIAADLQQVLADSRISYRDGVLIQLAYGIAQPELDLSRRAIGARTVAQQLGVFLSERHIRSVKDAYQNIAKNTEVLTRGNVPEFDRLLNWANEASISERHAAFRFACASVAATARPVLSMPRLNRGALTFARTRKLLSRLLDAPSGGAFQQFAVAALLHAAVDNHGTGTSRVETKNLNASDRSSFAAGDVQIVSGHRVIEALEVTANSWRTKMPDLRKVIRDNDLSRLHIVADRPSVDEADLAASLDEIEEDVSVLDVDQVVEVLLAILTRSQRADALSRLYEYLDRYQSDVDRVNFYVTQLNENQLVEGLRN